MSKRCILAGTIVSTLISCGSDESTPDAAVRLQIHDSNKQESAGEDLALVADQPSSPLALEAKPDYCRSSATPPSGHAVYYFNAQSGDDSKDGRSPTSAKKRLTQIASLNLSNGGTLCLAGNSSFTDTLKLINLGERNTLKSIYISSYDGTVATIVANQADASGATHGISIQNTGNVRIANMRVVGTANHHGSGIIVQRTGSSPADSLANDNADYTNIVISNVEASGFRAWYKFDASSNQYIWDNSFPFGHGIMVYTPMTSAGFAHVRVRNSLLSNNEYNGLLVFGSYASHTNRTAGTGNPALDQAFGHRDVIITNVKSSGNTGLSVQSILNQMATVTPRPAEAQYRNMRDHGVCAGSGILLAMVDGGIIEDSIAHNNGAANFGHMGPVGIWAFASRNIIIQRNESYANRSRGGDGGGFDLDISVSDSVLQYNYSHDNDGAGVLVVGVKEAMVNGVNQTFPPNRNNTVRYNISENDSLRRTVTPGIMASGAVHVHGDVHTAKIYNNTLYLNQITSGQAAGILVTLSTGHSVHFRNNLIRVNSATVPLIFVANPGTGDVVLQANAYVREASPRLLVKWVTAEMRSLEEIRNVIGMETFQGPVGYVGDPMIVNDATGVIANGDLVNALHSYRLKRSSPLHRGGLNLLAIEGHNMGDRDFFGIPISFGAASIGIGASALRAGHYRSRGSLIYINETAHYCTFSSLNAWQASGGPRNPATTPNLNLAGLNFQNDGTCATP